MELTAYSRKALYAPLFEWRLMWAGPPGLALTLADVRPAARQESINKPIAFAQVTRVAKRLEVA